MSVYLNFQILLLVIKFCLNAIILKVNTKEICEIEYLFNQC